MKTRLLHAAFLCLLATCYLPLATSLPAQTLITTSTNIDGLGGSTQRMVIATATSSTITLTNGAVYSSSNNFAPLNGNTIAGGAISVDAANTSLVFTIDDSSPSSQYIFASNTTAAVGGGALAFTAATSTVAFTNATFNNNNSTGTRGGGAVFMNGANDTLLLNNVRFASNVGNVASVGSANGGGGVYIMGSTNRITGTAGIFISNTTNSNGGAIGSNGGGSTVDLTDFSFLDNYSGRDGGAIGASGGAGASLAVNLSVSAGSTSRLAGNKDQTGANSIAYTYTAAASGTLGVNVGTGGVLDMLDPFRMNSTTAGSAFTVTKTGAGVWKLSGANTISKTNTAASTAAVNFTISEGMLYLYGTKDAATPITDPNNPTHPYTPTAASLTFTAADTVGMLNFSLRQNASLGIGGGNAITISSGALSNASFALAAGSILNFNLANATAGATAAPMLAIDTGNVAAGSVNIVTNNILNPYISLNYTDITPLLGNTYNLFSLTTLGAGLTSSLDTDSLLANATFGSTGISYSALLLSGYSADFGVTGNTLWVTLTSGGVTLTPANILTWTGNASATWLTGANWKANVSATATTFAQGDVVNLDGADTAGRRTLTLATTATVGSLNVSGTQTYAITGAGNLVAATNIATTAANGKLTLGAKAAPDGSTAPAPAAFTGVLDLAGQDATVINNFAGGVDIYSGALRISTAGQLGMMLSKLTFRGTPAATTGTLIIASGANVTLDSTGSTANRLTIADGSAAALMLEDTATLTLSGNAPAASGGAITLGAGANLALAAADTARYIFANNVVTGASANGGALSSAGAASTLSLNNAVFTSNTAGGNGGAFFSAANNALINLTDVSFLDNYATGTGGAIAVVGTGSSTININVSAGLTSRFAGNKDTGGANPNSIYVNLAGITLASFNIDVDTGGTLDMLDPISVNLPINSTGAQFVKTGGGVWNLAGSSTFSKLGNTGGGVYAGITVNEGMLYLYGAKDALTQVHDPVSNKDYTIKPASIDFYGQNGNGVLNFVLNTSATLGIGGGNSITYASSGNAVINNSTFTLAAGSILDFKLDNATEGAAAAAMLSIDTSLITTAGRANVVTGGTLNPFLNLDYTGSQLLGAYNLISLTAASGAGLDTLNDYNSILANTTFTLSGTAMNIDALNLSGYDANFGVTGNLLWVEFSVISPDTHILSWTGLAGDTLWKSATPNWALTSDLATGTTYAKGDIINLDLAAATPNTINVNTAVTISAMFVSGNADYTIEGDNPITTDASTAKPNLSGSAAATGKLTLGAKASPDGSVLTSDLWPLDAGYAGTLTLTNTTNTFLNGIDINSGQLVGNAANLGVGATATVTIAPTGTLTFNQIADGTYAAPIAGSGILNKTGAALTLAADSSAFDGTTNITTGALNLLSTARLGGAITINPNTLLAGADGAIAGSAGKLLTVAPSGTLRAGIGATTGQTLTIGGNLFLDDGSQLDLSSLGSRLLVLGSASQTGATTIAISSTSAGAYDLITAQGNWAGLDNTAWVTLNYANTPLDLSAYTLSIVDDTYLRLVFAATGANRVITWTGAADTAWETPNNWTVFDNSRTTFLAGDIVNIVGGASSSPTLTLAETATLAALYISGTASYTLAGAGIVADKTAGDLLNNTAATNKLALGRTAATVDQVNTTTFTGTLDLTAVATNTFAGGVDIYSGVLRIATPDQLGATLSQISFLGTPATATGALQIAAGASITFDGSLDSAASRLAIAAGNSGAILLEDNATLAFASNTANAITITRGALNLAAGDNATFLFTGNQGSAISVTANATNGAALHLNNALFDGNTSAANSGGGAIILAYSGSAIITSATFQNNTATQRGGAIYAANPGPYVHVTDALFQSNTSGLGTGANLGGGAIGNASANATYIFADTRFIDNIALGQGGGALLSISATAAFTFTNVLFQNNTANAGGGGAIYASANNNTFTFQDTSFLDNTAQAGFGGAIYLTGAQSSTISLITTTGVSTFAGNNVAGLSNSIHIANTTGNNIDTITVNTAAGSTLDMRDPMTGSTGNTQTITINKQGAGTWKLAGTSTFAATGATPATGATDSLNFTVTTGTLHLYRAGEVLTGATPVDAGKIILAATGAPSTFNLGSGATLSAGGGNIIAATKITLADNSILTLDLADPATADAGYSLLTLDTPALTSNWTQTLNLLNIDQLASDYCNLITLTGATFTDANLATLQANTTGLTTGYHLDLSADNRILQLLYDMANNTVLTWTGAADGSWLGATNWKTTTVTGTNFNRGDIINLANTNAANTAITVDGTAPVTVGGMYISGTTSYTITGATIVAAPIASTLNGTPVATSQLILGARAADDATALYTSDSDSASALQPFSPSALFTGTLTLDNASNNFTGGIIINTGELVGNDKTLGVGTTGAVTINTAGVLTFNQLADAAYSAPITGSGALNKTGAAALTLAGDLSTFTGTATIHAGALLLAPAGASLATPSFAGDITVNATGTLGGYGAVGNVTLATNATLQVGLPTPDSGLSPSAFQSFSLSSLTLATGANLRFTLYGSGTSDLITTGSLAIAGPGAIDIAGVIAKGSYLLIDSAATFGADATTVASSTTFATTNAGAPLSIRVIPTYTLDPAQRQLWLQLDITNKPNTWTGAATGNWSTGTNWNNDADKVFYAGDAVLFDDTALTKTVTVLSDITTAGMTVNNTTDTYTFQGAGAITTATAALDTTLGAATGATGQLIKQGSGLLVLANTATNNFTEGIALQGGALTGNADTLNVGASLATPSAGITTAASTTLTFDQSTTATYTAPITADGLIVMGASSSQNATLTLANPANTYTGGINVQAGTLSLANPATPIGAIAIAGNANLLIGATSALTIANPLTGAGLLSIDAAGAPVTITAGASPATPSAFTGTLALANSTFTLNATSAPPLAAATLQLNTGNATTVAPALQPFSLSALSLNGGKIDFSTSSATVATPAITVDTLAIGPSGTVQATLATGAVDTTASLFAQATGTPLARLVTAGAVTGAANLATITLLDQTGAIVDSTNAATAPITQNGATVATGAYNTALDATDGLNLNYKLTALAIATGQTVSLAPAAGDTGLFNVRISGTGNLAIDATNAPVTLAAANNFTGATTVTSGTLVAAASNALGGPTNTLTLANNAAYNLAGNTQTLATLTTAPATTVNLGGGILNLANGAINGTLTGAGLLNLAAGGNLAINSSNPALLVPTAIAANATLTLGAPDALGTGNINLAAATSTLTLANAATGTLANPLSGAGTVNFNGAGATTLAAPSTLAGTVNVNAPVTAANTAALGSAAVNVAAANTLTYTATGAIANAISGSGALNLASANGVTTLTGANTIANINILPNATILANAHSLGTATTNLAIANAANVTLAQPATTLGNVTMTGASTLGYAKTLAPGNTLTLTSLKSDNAGATLSLNTNIGATTPLVDQLTITNPAANTGKFTLALNNTGPEPKPAAIAAGLALPFIDAASAGAATFAGAGNITAPEGALWLRDYTWRIDAAAGAAPIIAISQGRLSAAGANIIANATGAMPLTWFTELDTLGNRLGDLHIDPREKPGIDLWLHGYTQRLNVNDKDMLVPFSETQYGTAVGLDYGGRPTGHGAATYTGAFIGYGRSTRDIDGLDATANVDSLQAGLYAALITPDGWYLDLLGKYNRFKSTFTATDTAGTASGNYTNNAIGLSVEAGKRIPLGAHWSLTPSAQAALARINGATYTATTGATTRDVTLSQTTSRQLRAGAQLAYRITTTKAQIIQPYAKAYLANQWTNGGEVLIANTTAPYTPTIKGARFEAGLGVNWQFTKATQFYLDYEYAKARDYTKPYGLTLGFNYAW